MDPTLIDAHFRRYNAAPLAEFCGLSPNQMHRLMYEPLGAESPVRLPASLPDAVLDRVPFFRLTEELLRLVGREGRIKLTAGGALPRKFLHELYAHGILREEYVDEGFVSINREIDSTSLHTLHINTTLAGLVKKTHGALTLTKKGLALQQPGQRPALFRLVLDTFTSKFNWGYHDVFENGNSPVGQLAWAYSIYLLAQFGNVVRPVAFYAEKYQQAFPFLVNSLPEVSCMTKEEQLANYYSGRVFFRFGTWFGLVEIEPQQFGPNAAPDRVIATALLPQVFEVFKGRKV